MLHTVHIHTSTPHPTNSAAIRSTQHNQCLHHGSVPILKGLKVRASQSIISASWWFQSQPSRQFKHSNTVQNCVFSTVSVATAACSIPQSTWLFVCVCVCVCVSTQNINISKKSRAIMSDAYMFFALHLLRP